MHSWMLQNDGVENEPFPFVIEDNLRVETDRPHNESKPAQGLIQIVQGRGMPLGAVPHHLCFGETLPCALSLSVFLQITHGAIVVAPLLSFATQHNGFKFGALFCLPDLPLLSQGFFISAGTSFLLLFRTLSPYLVAGFWTFISSGHHPSNTERFESQPDSQSTSSLFVLRNDFSFQFLGLGRDSFGC